MSARRQFVLECGRAAAAFVLLACDADRVSRPTCAPLDDAPPDPAPQLDRKDVYIVDGFTGLQLGTKDNPYSVRGAGEFDALMRFLLPTDYLAVHYSGRLQTAGVYRWGELAARNLGKGWTVDGDAEISIDPNAVVDVDAQPLYVLAGGASSVTGITAIGGHSALADRWRSARKSLRTGAVLLDGDGAIDRLTARNFGSLGAETFVAEIMGSGSIAAGIFTDYDPSSSDSQVTVWRNIGRYARHERNKTFASGDNRVQAHTIYQASSGVIRGNESYGARVGVYGDYYATKGLEIDGNRFRVCEHGVQLKLDSTDPLSSEFSHDDYLIGPNEIESSGANVSLDTCGPPTSTRFIRGIEIDASLSVESFGAEWSRATSCRRAA